MFEESPATCLSKLLIFCLLPLVFCFIGTESEGGLQTNSESGGEAYRTNKPLSEKWETRDWLILTDTINLEKYTS